MMRKMRRTWRNPSYRAILLYLFVVLAAFVIMVRMNQSTTDELQRQAHALEEQQEQLEINVVQHCRLSNSARHEGNRRGEIIKEALLTASDSRRAAALGSSEPWARISNAKTANRYVELAAEIEEYEYLDCNDDGEPDLP